MLAQRLQKGMLQIAECSVPLAWYTEMPHQKLVQMKLRMRIHLHGHQYLFGGQYHKLVDCHYTGGLQNQCLDNTIAGRCFDQQFRLFRPPSQLMFLKLC